MLNHSNPDQVQQLTSSHMSDPYLDPEGCKTDTQGRQMRYRGYITNPKTQVQQEDNYIHIIHRYVYLEKPLPEPSTGDFY